MTRTIPSPLPLRERAEVRGSNRHKAGPCVKTLG